jgi:hypothetical protein
MREHDGRFPLTASSDFIPQSLNRSQTSSIGTRRVLHAGLGRDGALVDVDMGWFQQCRMAAARRFGASALGAEPVSSSAVLKR